ncbi:MAG: hypothetical protein MUC51_12465 [Anaerolineae bacterium]|nr:hypothetical protein [Anaerolineae bacterium]
MALLANFMLVPLLAFAITRVLPLDQSLQIGLIVLATTAGAPFLVKEVAAAKGNLSLGVGLMFLLMVVTIFYVPIVLPLILIPTTKRLGGRGEAAAPDLPAVQKPQSK